MTMSVVTGTDYQSSDPFQSVVDPNDEMEDFVTRNLQNVVFYAPKCQKANNILFYDGTSSSLASNRVSMKCMSQQTSRLLFHLVNIALSLIYPKQLRPLPCDGKDEIAIGSILQTVVATFDISGSLIENYAFSSFLCPVKFNGGIFHNRQLATSPVAPNARILATTTRSPTRAPTVKPAWGWIIPGGGGCRLCNPDTSDLVGPIILPPSNSIFQSVNGSVPIPTPTVAPSSILLQLPTVAPSSLPIQIPAVVPLSSSKHSVSLKKAIKTMEKNLTSAIVAALLQNSQQVQCLRGSIADVDVKVTLRDNLSTTPFGCVNP